MSAQISAKLVAGKVKCDATCDKTQSDMYQCIQCTLSTLNIIILYMYLTFEVAV